MRQQQEGWGAILASFCDLVPEWNEYSTYQKPAKVSLPFQKENGTEKSP
jgi:hypothetical protein